LFNIKASSKTEKKDLDVQMLVIIDFIRSEFGFLTEEEIKEAFKMYFSKKFGHKEIFRILDVIVVSDVLNCFINYRSDSLRFYVQKKQNKAIESSVSLSEEEVFNLMTETINNRYSDFLITGEINGTVIDIFKELIHRKILPMPSDENPKIAEYYQLKFSIAEKQIKEEIASEISSKNKNSIKEEILKIKNKNSSKVEIRARKLVLIDFFNKHKKNGDLKIL